MVARSGRTSGGSTAKTGTALVVAALVTAIGSAGSAAAQPASSSTYVVVLKPETSDVAGAAAALARAHGGTVGFVYRHALHGFSVRLPAAGAAAIAKSPAVAYVEADQAYTVTAQSMPTGVQRVFALDNPTIAIDGADDKRVDVDVAVIDTGIQLDHPDLNVAEALTASRSSPRAARAEVTGMATARTSLAPSVRSTTGSESSESHQAHGCGPCGSSITAVPERLRRSSPGWTG